jgi:MoxR-vWA-beta-propeller ternary system domain bpX4
MIQHLRQQEEILLYNNVLLVNAADEAATLTFLAHEYQTEALDFPHIPPVFDEQAALWAAKTVYIAAQLMLFRTQKTAELSDLLPAFANEITPSAIVSADLCLRFLPDMLTQLKGIDSQDGLIDILENTLSQWHYSGIQYGVNTENTDFSLLKNNDCLLQLYANRITFFKKMRLAQHPAFQSIIAANMGIYGSELW